MGLQGSCGIPAAGTETVAAAAAAAEGNWSAVTAGHSHLAVGHRSCAVAVVQTVADAVLAGHCVPVEHEEKQRVSSSTWCCLQMRLGRRQCRH